MIEKKKEFDNLQKQVLADIANNKDTYYTNKKKRNLARQMKNELWNNSDIHDNFNSDIFRSDCLGNVAIKYISYNNNDNRNIIFAYEYEHLVSYSNGGSNNIKNLRILNAGINRSKKNTELFTLNYHETHGYCSISGMKFDDLLEELEYCIHRTCKKYNLLFIKKDKIYTLEKVNGKYSGYNNRYYNEKYEELREKINNGDAMKVQNHTFDIAIFVSITIYEIYEIYKHFIQKQ